MFKRIKAYLRRVLYIEVERIDWVRQRLQTLPPGVKLLDAGCGSQQYRKYCTHLDYKAQDLGGYSLDQADTFASSGEAYAYGELDYQGDIWNIPAPDRSFGAILCTEVLEHIPRPTETLHEFSRLLIPGGQLILTVPSNCLRHQDPFFFFSGFSDHYLRQILSEAGFDRISIYPVGDYHRFMLIETFRSALLGNFLSFLMLAPALLVFLLRQRVPTRQSINTLCCGYHVTAFRRADGEGPA